ncbi:MAG: energy transducer TonB [Flavobacteriales bacterium AspAUS03]
MQANKILESDFLDILFEKRNKSYGAYELRRKYARRLTYALLLSAILPTLGVFFFLLFPNDKVYKKDKLKIKEIKLEDIKIDELKFIELPSSPPSLPPKEIPKQALEKFTLPKVVSDHEVKPEDIPPKQEDLKNQPIGIQEVEGIKDADIPPLPPINTGQGVVQIHKVDNKSLTNVDIPAKYPGNWNSFLRDKLNYSEYAQEVGIQGSVIVRFVVDIDGRVSDVRAISGPKELREEAENAIKKSEKWIPAEQNGRLVKAYKKQMIIFHLKE